MEYSDTEISFGYETPELVPFFGDLMIARGKSAQNNEDNETAYGEGGDVDGGDF